MTTYPASCLIKFDPNIQHKRKRTDKKTVRFDEEHTVIIDTYSPFDYDRGSVFSFPPVQYKLNPNLLSNNNSRSDIPSLSLEIPSSPCDSEASSPDLDQAFLPIHIPAANKEKKKKPKLTIDTSVCSGDGPLFFTKLSTNHVRHGNDGEDDKMNDYLIPISTPTIY
ncbi:hypothetical protein BD770DRAFT_474890 [Pilaira anomala]|nr:hypothetical protein BD770DRAFT_474890 [Pilaira anomala]